MRAALLGSIFAIVASALMVSAFWIVDYLPTNDGAAHIFSGHLENHYAELSEADRSLVQLHPQLTAHGFRAFFVPLEGLFRWRTAFRLTLSLAALLWAWGLWILMRLVRPGSGWALLAFPSAFQWALYMGFFSFYIATAFGFWTLALAIRHDEWTRLERFLISAMLFIVAILHSFPALIVCSMLACVVVTRVSPLFSRKAAAELGLLALMALPASAVSLMTAMGNVESIAFQETLFRPLLERVHFLSSGFVAGKDWQGIAFPLLAVVGFALALRRFWAQSPTERALLLGGLVLLVAALTLPTSTPGWQHLSARAIPMAIVCGMALLPDLRHSLLRATLTVCTLGLLAGSLQLNRTLEHACAPAYSGLAAPLKLNGYTSLLALRSCEGAPGLPSPSVDSAHFLAHAGNLYAAQLGGLARGFHGETPIHAFTLKFLQFEPVLIAGGWEGAWARLFPSPTEIPVLDAERERLVTWLAQRGAHYDNLVLYGPPAQRALISKFGFVSWWQNDAVDITEFKGCPFTVELPAGWGNETPAIIEYGWWPQLGTFWTAHLHQQKKSPLRVPLARSPCGPIWLRVILDRDRSGSATPGDVFCQGAPPDGHIRLAGGPSETEYRCLGEDPK